MTPTNEKIINAITEIETEVLEREKKFKSNSAFWQDSISGDVFESETRTLKDIQARLESCSIDYRNHFNN